MTLRVIFDTNVFISYLLATDESSSISRIVDAAIERRCKLLAPPELIEELILTINRKKYLRERITVDSEVALVTILRQFAIPAAKNDRASYPTTRDWSDDYLLIAAITHNVDFLVTGDSDLLVLGRAIERPQIVAPNQFTVVLDL